MTTYRSKYRANLTHMLTFFLQLKGAGHLTPPCAFVLAHCGTSRWKSKLQGNFAVGAVAPLGFQRSDIFHVSLLAFAASEAFLALYLSHEVVHSRISVWVRFLFKVSIAQKAFLYASC